MARPPKPWLKGQVDDLVSLPQLDDTILLQELHERYKLKKIYTYVGDILVAVNPFEQLPIYGKEIQAKYYDSVKSSNPPHIFAIADQAYFTMVRNSRNQCAVISGESGAGKTESAKLLMRHIIHLCHSGTEGQDIEQRVIEVNPLLEAFGNAATRMNHNSSRFGKYTEVNFDNNGHVVGAKISQYLLEKSRVVKQNTGENNFHVLYYVFSSPKAQALGLTSPRDFPYVSTTPGLPNAARMYSSVVQALDTVGFSPSEQDNIHAILAAVLHIGNLAYSEARPDQAQVSSSPQLVAKISELLGLNPEELKEALTAKTTYTRGETIRRTYSCELALVCRDAFAKALYGRLFEWIVSHINTLLAPGMSHSTKKNLLEIGILDIFGFEHFDRNGFEQLCINIANEQLQNFFNEHIFKQELEEYKKEGVDGSNIAFTNNESLLELFFGRPVGVMSLLDEECRFPRATDITLIEKYKQTFASHKDFAPARTSEPCFTIHHYAGDVTYHTEGFLDRNKDELPADVVGLCFSSNVPLIHQMFEANQDGQPGKGGSAGTMNTARKRAPTVGHQFTSSLRELVAKMQRCMAHFVRCIKPNYEQEPNNYVDEFVDRQLRYTGMLETTRIRREGFSFRPSFADFMERFGILAYGPSAQVAPSAETCRTVLSKSNVGGWLVGKTKVFLKYWQVEQLDKSIKLYHDNAKTLQKLARGFSVRKFVRTVRQKRMEQLQQIKAFSADLSRTAAHYSNLISSHAAEDMRRFAAGIKPKPAAPPKPRKSEKELKREASITWWREKEQPKGAGQDANGQMLDWFHGIISRQEAERLLKPRFIGTFLVRVSENRFGYTLSYRVADRCRHYMIEQDTRGRYALRGADKVCNSLNELIEWFTRHRINPEGDMLREPCGQEINVVTGEMECNYGELVGGGYKPMAPAASRPLPSLPSRGGGDDAPPPVPRKAKPAHLGGGAPPPIMRDRKPTLDSGPPPISRATKPRL